MMMAMIPPCTTCRGGASVARRYVGGRRTAAAGPQQQVLTTTAALFLYLAGSRSPLLLLLHCVEDGIGCGISRLDASPSPLLTFTLYQHCYRYSVLAPSAYAFRSQSRPCSAHCYYLLHPHAPACAPPAADSTRHSTCGGSNFCHSSAVCAISARVFSAPFGSSTTKPAPRRLHAYWLAAPVSRRPKRLASSRLPTSPNMTLLAETCPPVTSSSIRPGSPTRCCGRGNGSRETG